MLFLISGDSVMAAYFSRFAEAFRQLGYSKLAVVSELRHRKMVGNIVRRYCVGNYVDIGHNMFRAFLMNFSVIVRIFYSVKDGNSLCRLTFRGSKIGSHLYDSMLRRSRKSTINKIGVRERAYVILEFTYFLACISVIEKLKPNIVILPDNTYRQGPLFDYLLRNWRGELYAGIDMNSVTVHKYKCPEDIVRHCRTPELKLIQELETNEEAMSEAKKYFSKRCTGNLPQHDVIRAFDQEKREINRSMLRMQYDLNENKKIVLIMAHIFSDAPHGYPGMLYRDYSEWLIDSCVQLSGNREVEILIKEHPSAELYGEEGAIEALLSKVSLSHRLLDKKINTNSLFSSVDAIVTCGGTAAMEFAAKSVPVLVASEPPYHNLGFCIVPKTIEEYALLLSRIQELSPLSATQKRRALLSLYCINCLFGIGRLRAGFGSQDIYKGANFSDEKFFQELERTGVGTKEFSYLVNAIKVFINSNEQNLRLVE